MSLPLGDGAANCASTVRFVPHWRFPPEMELRIYGQLLIVMRKNIRLSLAPVFQKRQVQTAASGRGLETLPQNAMRDCIFNSVLGFERMSSATKAWRVAGTRLPVGRGNRYG